jgi:glycyl-tRNA synthetase beta chain
MANDILLEIGLEEVPARFLSGAIRQLADKTAAWLQEMRIAHAGIDAYATPRRLTVYVKQAADRQEDISEESKGPAKKIALDEQGNWTKAALGFARSQGVEPESLYVKTVNGVEYVYAKKEHAGRDTASLLAEGLTAIITSLAFPKNMRWGSHDLRFVRPIRWIVALHGKNVIDLEIAGVRSGRVTQGHRFLGKAVELSEPGEYIAKLNEQYVIADIGQRRDMIVSQIERLAEERGWTVPINDDLLEEVLYLVEYPTVLTGSFDASFLNIPQEVLITSMREHQRYFPVLDREGKLLPHFITVRNGDDRSLEQVARGNEKVLRARLSDAKFFYEEDLKMPIDQALSKLEQIVFHEELGTIGDKVRRIRKIADELANLCRIGGAELETIRRAAAICKFDLVTQMVYEFPELQGVMGTDYARKAGEPEAVAAAINEHYQPRHASDSTPASLPGAIVSIADKIDTIAGCFAIGIIPTGSQDPYALRRQAQGIVQTVLDHRLPVGLKQLFGIALGIHKESRSEAFKRGDADILRDMEEFFGLRVKNVLGEIARYDVVDAVMAGGFSDVGSAVRRCRVLSEAVRSGNDMKQICDSFTRVMNLAAKADADEAPDEALFREEAERSLYDAWKKAHAAYEAHMANGEEREALSDLSSLSEPINAFFDSVMVMAEDERIRANRLSLLRLIDRDLRRFADFNRIVWSA